MCLADGSSSKPAMETDQDCESEHKLLPMRSDCGIITQADGSCSFHQGNTSIMAAVYGPTEVRANRERLDRAHVDLLYKPKAGLPGCTDKAIESLVRNTCEAAILTMLHPRTAINVVLQELQNSGSLVACCINASCQALLDAAVPLKFTVAAVTCAIDKDGVIVLDPTEKVTDSVMDMTFVFEGMDKKVVSCNSVGQCSKEQFQTCLLACREAADEIFQFYRDSMNRKLARSS